MIISVLYFIRFSGENVCSQSGSLARILPELPGLPVLEADVETNAFHYKSDIADHLLLLRTFVHFHNSCKVLKQFLKLKRFFLLEGKCLKRLNVLLVTVKQTSSYSV